MSGFPWDEAMAFGLGQLGLPPRALWAMTPRELAAALAGHGAHLPGGDLSRAELGRLMADFPDEVF